MNAVDNLRQVSAGRAGRLWLRRRLEVARRGANLLDQQLRILRREQERLRLLTADTEAAWQDSCREAERWLLRAAIVGGERDIRLATELVPAQVEIDFRIVMGVRYPDEAAVTVPDSSPSERPAGSAGLVQAIAAYRAAVQAAARHATADAARRILEAEVATIQRRKRAISDRWIPRLETALRELIRRLEDAERDELVRLHWVAGRRGSGER
jgi:V/A-type H+-transporting ATPase subunit D